MRWRKRTPTTSARRSEWIDHLLRVVTPVLESGASRMLAESMPLAAAPGFEEPRGRSSRLEAVVRSVIGLAPWLESGDGDDQESSLRRSLVPRTHAALTAVFDPDSPDYCDPRSTRQALVEAAFLAEAIGMAPSVLGDELDDTTRSAIVEGLAATRVHQPNANNWMLFSAMVEVGLARLGEDWNADPIDEAIGQFENWYVGDGGYADGEWFRWDYYNSFVIHPMLLEILTFCEERRPGWSGLRGTLLKRSQRMAGVLERMVSPDGTYPPLGRSLAYRCGAFHLLAHLALRGDLPADLPEGRVRGALFRSIERTLGPATTYDSNGWLRVGLVGHQPALAETYISTGSLYLCTAAFLPLGLDRASAFWAAPEEQSTWEAMWSNEWAERDEALAEVSLKFESGKADT